MNRFRNFLYGRNGADQLSMFVLLLGVVVNLLAQIFQLIILTFVALLLVFYALFRIFSKNVAKRQMENQKFLNIWYKIKGLFRRGGGRTYSNTYSQAAPPKDKAHKYFKCPSCKTRLRVPKGKGKIQITCPKCGERFIKKT